jgi:hypothetical protein
MEEPLHKDLQIKLNQGIATEGICNLHQETIVRSTKKQETKHGAIRDSGEAIGYAEYAPAYPAIPVGARVYTYL